MQNISQYLQEFDEDFYTEGQFECDCHEKIKAFLLTSVENAVREERARIRAALPKIEDHICAYNDGASRCVCYGGLRAEVLDLLDNQDVK
jgi:hypothetical protein